MGMSYCVNESDGVDKLSIASQDCVWSEDNTIELSTFVIFDKAPIMFFKGRWQDFDIYTYIPVRP